MQDEMRKPHLRVHSRLYDDTFGGTIAEINGNSWNEMEEWRRLGMEMNLSQRELNLVLSLAAAVNAHSRNEFGQYVEKVLRRKGVGRAASMARTHIDHVRKQRNLDGPDNLDKMKARLRKRKRTFASHLSNKYGTSIAFGNHEGDPYYSGNGTTLWMPTGMLRIPKQLVYARPGAVFWVSREFEDVDGAKLRRCKLLVCPTSVSAPAVVRGLEVKEQWVAEWDEYIGLGRTKLNALERLKKAITKTMVSKLSGVRTR